MEGQKEAFLWQNTAKTFTSARTGAGRGRYIKARTAGRKAVWGYLYGATYAEVKERLIQKKAECGFYRLSAGELTFGELAAQWLASIASGVKESTLSHYHYTLHRYLMPVLEDVKVQSFTEQLLEQRMLWVIAPPDRSHQPLGAASAGECLGMLRRICKYAAHLRLDPPAGCLRPSSPGQKRQGAAPFSGRAVCHQAFVLKAPTARKAGLMLQMQLGLRIGEVCGLQWGDFDLKAGTFDGTAHRQPHLHPRRSYQSRHPKP